MPATMSLLGLYNWDSTILDGLIVPDDVDRSALINNLLRECAELEILYPQPNALKFFVGEWAKERLPVWKKLAATLKFEYDPISNYDRKEEWTDENSGTSEAMTAGYNSAGADVPEAKSSANSNGKRTGRSYGNIGVTTSQQMLESERDIALFNFIGIVAHDIIKSICICIY